MGVDVRGSAGPLVVGVVLGILINNAYVRLYATNEIPKPLPVQQNVPAQTVSAITMEAGANSATDSWEAMRAGWMRREADLLGRFPGLVERQGNALVVPTAKGPKTFVTARCSEDGGECAEYYLANLFAVGRVIGVNAKYSETGDYTLIDRDDGNEVTIPDEPLLSPDGRTLASGTQDVHISGGNVYGLSIVTIDGPMRRVLFRSTSELPWVEHVEWIAADCLRFDAGVANNLPDPEYDDVKHSPFVAIRKKGQWQVKQGSVCR